MIFKQCTLGYGIYIREFGSRIGVIFQETDQLNEDFSLDQGNQEMLLKNVKKKSVLF